MNGENITEKCTKYDRDKTTDTVLAGLWCKHDLCLA